MFVVTFVIMLPIATATGDPVKGWEAGLVWVFFQSFILMIGGFVAPCIRHDHAARRAARHARGRLDRLHLDAAGAGDVPDAGDRHRLPRHHPGRLVRRVRYPRGIPAGLVAIAFGMLVAWGSAALGLDDRRHEPRRSVAAAFSNFGFSLPMPAIDHVFSGFEYLGVILVTAIPFGIYDLVEAMDNVESAEAAGDHYPTTRVLTADGVVSLIGCLMGNPFINAVYIGHPGWKSMGGRIGYSFATGVMVIVLCWFGVVAVLLALVPVVAISPILLYIGMLIGAQAFQTTPTKHAPAIVLALMPHLAAWGKTLIDGALGAAGVHVTPDAIGMEKPAGRRALSRARDPGRRRDPDRAGARRDRGLHHRAQFDRPPAFARGRRGADLLRLHARRSRSASAAASASRRWSSRLRLRSRYSSFGVSAASVRGLDGARRRAMADRAGRVKRPDARKRPGRLRTTRTRYIDAIGAPGRPYRHAGAAAGLAASSPSRGRNGEPSIEAHLQVTGGTLELVADVHCPDELEPAPGMRPRSVSARAQPAIAGASTAVRPRRRPWSGLSRAHRIQHDGPLNAFTDHHRGARALREARPSMWAGPRRAARRTACGRALRGEEPVRRRRPADPRRLEDQPRPCRPPRAMRR